MNELRLREMDMAGIDVQLLSYNPSRLQTLSATDASTFARRINDYLYKQIIRHPSRFAGLAILPTPDPPAAVAELKRTVT